MEITFSPSPDVVVILNALLDKFENHAHQNTDNVSGSSPQRTRPIKIALADIALPAYFSQTDPEPRFIANQQLQQLSELGLAKLAWLPGESGHLLNTVMLPKQPATCRTEHASPTSCQHPHPSRNLAAGRPLPLSA
jgi:hypothetical protein